MRRLALAVVVLAALLLVVDRAGELYASRSIGDEVQASAGLDARPDVDITGFPFLTQALSGRYERIEVSARDVRGGAVVLSRVDATLHGARAPLSDVLRQDVDRVPAERLTARALVEYAELSQSYEGQELTLESEGDRVLVTGDLTGFDAALEVQALAGVEIVEGELVIRTEEVSFGEGGTRQPLTEAVRDEVDVRVPVGELPYDLVLTAAEVRPDGVAVRAEATDVVLVATSGGSP